MSGPGGSHPLKHLAAEMDEAARELYRRLERGEVATTRCARCERTAFPPRTRCPACWAEQEWVELPREGTLHAFTTQEVGLRFRAPAVLGLAEVGDAVLPGVVDGAYESLRIGQPVRVETRPEPDTGLTLLAFVPA